MGFAFILLLAWLVLLTTGIVTIVGALKMMRLQSYGWAMTASVLALLPCSPAGLLGLVVGIWALVVLSRPEVKRAFLTERTAARRATGASPQRNSGCGIAILVAAIVVCLAVVPLVLGAIVAALWLLPSGDDFEPRQPPPYPSYSAPSDGVATRIPSALGKEASLIWGPEGPRLSDAYAQEVLRLQPPQIEEVDKALQAAHREYLDLEKELIQQQTDEQGHVVTTIAALPAATLATLEDRLWTRLDASLDPSQQSIARSSLKLDPSVVESMNPILPSEMVKPGPFGWGNQGARIEIWRFGTWYQWKVEARGYAYGGTGPQLPEEYRRFWKEPPETNPPPGEPPPQP